MTLSHNELVALINTAWRAVDASLAGPIMGNDDCGGVVLRSPGYQTFVAVVQKIIPTVLDGTVEHSEVPKNV